jgi:hypothetical protein
MNIKENLDFLKDEISTEEKFFEGFFKLERVWKRYKVIIIGVSVVAIGLFAGININSYIQLQNKIKTNEAFNILLKDSKNEKAKEILKDNPKLLNIANYLNKEKKTKNIQYLSDILAFNQSIEDGNLDKLNNILLKSDFLLKEYAIFQKALQQALNLKYKDAKETLKLVPKSSSISQLVNKLNHYLLTK